jgi:hypothetical protein
MPRAGYIHGAHSHSAVPPLISSATSKSLAMNRTFGRSRSDLDHVLSRQCESRARAPHRRFLKRNRSAVNLGEIANNREPRPEPCAASSARTPRRRTASRIEGSIPGPSSSIAITIRSPSFEQVSLTRARAHLHALSSRLPSISSRSSRCPRKACDAGASISMLRSRSACSRSSHCDYLRIPFLDTTSLHVEKIVSQLLS